MKPRTSSSFKVADILSRTSENLPGKPSAFTRFEQLRSSRSRGVDEVGVGICRDHTENNPFRHFYQTAVSPVAPLDVTSLSLNSVINPDMLAYISSAPYRISSSIIMPHSNPYLPNVSKQPIPSAPINWDATTVDFFNQLPEHIALNSSLWATLFGMKVANRRKGGQIRFTLEQTRGLESTFGKNKYLSPADRKNISKSLDLSERQVKTWFQNRRAKWRRQSQGERGLINDQCRKFIDDVTLCPQEDIQRDRFV